MWDAILSVHLNPLTCGVAKFNQELGRRLRVPVRAFTPRWTGRVLLSIHPREVPAYWWDQILDTAEYDVFLHSGPTHPSQWRMITRAKDVFVGNEEVKRACEFHGVPAILLWAPSLLSPISPYAQVTVFTFGMAHKFEAPQFERLKQVLETIPPSPLCPDRTYGIRVSTGIHEGTPWDKTFTQNLDLMERVFGAHLQPLGFISDALVLEQFHLCDAVALFYPKGVRANNTTLWAAMEQGCTVITNCDADSPPELVHGQTCYDINRLTDWPTPLSARAVRDAAAGRTWDKLVTALQAVTV